MRTSSKIIVDTNCVLRWFLGDIAEQEARISALLDTAPEECLVLHSVSIAEITYVLRHKGYDHAQIFTIITEFCQYPTVESLDAMVSQALEIYRDTTLDYEDCMLLAYGSVRGAAVAGFDEQLKREARKRVVKVAP